MRDTEMAMIGWTQGGQDQEQAGGTETVLEAQRDENEEVRYFIGRADFILES